MDDLNNALAPGGEMFADVPNLTNVVPTVQISEVLGQGPELEQWPEPDLLTGLPHRRRM